MRAGEYGERCDWCGSGDGVEWHEYDVDGQSYYLCRHCQDVADRSIARFLARLPVATQALALMRAGQE